MRDTACQRIAALILRLNDLRLSRDHLVALLADHSSCRSRKTTSPLRRLWTAHFANAEGRDSAPLWRFRHSPDSQQLEVRAVEVEDDDWARRTQADLPAIQIGRVIVAPPWDLPDSEIEASVPEPRAPSPQPRGSPHPVLVIIEPSRGFGTGHHQSTRLCIALLQNRNLVGQTMIDVGTGSGVLAITAAKLGAAYVAAIDVDPDAVENARENIAANAVTEVVDAHVEDFTTASRLPADVVTANLTGTLLARHAVELGRLVRPTGTLIISGFNVEERQMVEEAFASAFAIGESAEEDDWWAFVLSPTELLTPNPLTPNL